MSSAAIISDISEALLAASLPIGPNSMEGAAKLVANYYEDAPADIRIPIEEIPDRFGEMWGFWLENPDKPSKELKAVIRVAVGIDREMEGLANEYFKLEEKQFMAKSHAIALIGCAPLIRTLVVEQHLGLDRIRAVLNVPAVTFDAINAVINSIGINPPFSSERITTVHEADVADVAALFGDTKPEDAGDTFRGLLSTFSRCETFADNVIELGLIRFEPYQFMLYFELLTLEMVDRFPGRAIYECTPRSSNVKTLWNSMYHPTQEKPLPQQRQVRLLARRGVGRNEALPPDRERLNHARRRLQHPGRASLHDEKARRSRHSLLFDPHRRLPPGQDTLGAD